MIASKGPEYTSLFASRFGVIGDVVQVQMSLNEPSKLSENCAKAQKKAEGFSLETLRRSTMNGCRSGF